MSRLLFLETGEFDSTCQGLGCISSRIQQKSRAGILCNAMCTMRGPMEAKLPLCHVSAVLCCVSDEIQKNG